MKAIAVVPGTTTVQLVDRPEPAIMAPDDIKLRVLRVGICGTDRKTSGSASGLAKGADVLAGGENPHPNVILIASGSEVSIALQAHGVLTSDGIPSRVVSMPSWELFERQPQAYREAILPASVRARVSIEAASPFGWERYVGSGGAIIGTAHFGASAPGAVVMREFGFTAEQIVETAKTLLNRGERTVSQ